MIVRISLCIVISDIKKENKESLIDLFLSHGMYSYVTIIKSPNIYSYIFQDSLSEHELVIQKPAPFVNIIYF